MLKDWLPIEMKISPFASFFMRFSLLSFMYAQALVVIFVVALVVSAAWHLVN